MLMFTPNQLQELMDIIDKHHSLFITTNIGTSYLTQREKQVLKSAGVDLEKWKGSRGKVEEAFSFGLLSVAIGDDRAKKMNYKDFKRFVKSKNFMPLSTKEKSAIEHLKYQVFSDVKNLNNKVKNDINTILVNQDKKLQANFHEVTREAAIKTVEMRGSVRDMISEMGHRTGQWERDLGRIAEYTLHNAYEEGRGAQLEKEYGENVLVYKDVYPGACKHCIKHYLTAGIGSQPVIFKLSKLKANGTNIGRKVDDWQPTLGPVHPYCRCSVNGIPEGYVWDDKTQGFVRGRLKIKNERVRDRKKISVKIGDKEYLV